MKNTPRDSAVKYAHRLEDENKALLEALEHSSLWLEAAAKEYPKAAKNLLIRARMNRDLLKRGDAGRD